jgi:hypothetical protein
MAAIPVTFQGILFFSDVGIGGGPIVPGGPPLGIWGGGNVPMPTPPIANVPGAPGYQPPLGIWGPGQMPPGFWGGGMGPGVKPQPPGQPPLGFWGGRPPEYVDIGGPGPQPRPEHPIYFPPPGSQPPLGIWGPPDMPPGYWGGGMGPGVKPQPRPEHPIVLPPDLPETTPPPDERPIDWKVGWTPATGWVVVGVPTVPVPTPSS